MKLLHLKLSHHFLLLLPLLDDLLELELLLHVAFVGQELVLDVGWVRANVVDVQLAIGVRQRVLLTLLLAEQVVLCLQVWQVLEAVGGVVQVKTRRWLVLAAQLVCVEVLGVLELLRVAGLWLVAELIVVRLSWLVEELAIQYCLTWR